MHKPPEPPRRHTLFPKKLQICLQPALKPVLKARGEAASKLIAQWPQVVDGELARISSPESLTFTANTARDGTLTLAVDAGFAPIVQHQIPQIIERLSTFFGYRAVARIVLKQRVQAPTPPAPAPRARRKETVSLRLDEVHDAELRAALSSFADSLNQ